MDLFERAVGRDAAQFGAAIDGDAALFEGVAHGVADVRVHPREQVRAALDHGDRAPDPFEEMRHFERDGAAAEDDERCRDLRLIEERIARPEPGIIETTHLGNSDRRAGRNQARFKSDLGLSAVTQRHAQRVRIEKSGGAAHEFEPPAGELSLSVAREVSDELAFAVANGPRVDTSQLGAEPEFRAAAHAERAIGRFDQGLARHASAQDAKAAEFLRAVDHQRAQAQGCGRPRRGIAGAAAADHREVTRIELAHLSTTCASRRA